MDFYRIAKTFFGIRSHRVKLLSLAAAHTLGVRYIGVFLDPVMSCNLRCKMCYFSSDANKPKPVAPMTEDYIDKLADDIFRHAVKLQIGCGAEPTLYRHLVPLVRAARRAGVPYIEITTNAQLLTLDVLLEMAEAGLGGMTLSLHGTTAETYEYLMGRASFDKLLGTIAMLKTVKERYPDFRLRVNYTFNNMNVRELAGIWQLFDGVHIDILQIRPVQNLGDTEYDDFDMSRIAADYDSLIATIARACSERGTMFAGPSPENLAEVNREQDELAQEIERVTYYYVSPDSCYRDDYALGKDTFRSYHRRHHTVWHCVKKALFTFKKKNGAADHTKKMNYEIK